jgi:hypothetical protein
MMELDTPTCERCGTPLIRYTRRYGVKGAYVKAQGWHHGGSVCAENVRAQRDALRDAAVALLDALNDGDIDVDEYDGRCTALRAAVALTDRNSDG